MLLGPKFLLLDRCPHCGVDNPNLPRVHFLNSLSHDGTNKREWGIYECKRCGGIIMASAKEWNQGLLSIFPSPEIIDDSVPVRAKEYLKQAISSLNAPAGAIMLCASSLDAMLKEKGYKEGNLHSRIESAAKDHLLTDEMKLWAHEVRLDANDQRHSDLEVALPTTEDAKKTLEFVKAVAQFLFVLPARVNKGLKDAKGETKSEVPA